MSSSPARTPDLRRLDIASAARNGVALQGRWPLAHLERLREGDAVPEGGALWSARFQERPRAGFAPEVRLRLSVTCQIDRTCQRCLQPVSVPLDVTREFLFVADANQAAELDADNDQEDVLELTRYLDLGTLIEDELLLALPLVPRHDVCPQPLTAPASPGSDEADAPHPFAALAALRRPGER